MSSSTTSTSKFVDWSIFGARILEEHDDDGGYRTTVLADPVGNEFCVVQR